MRALMHASLFDGTGAEQLHRDCTFLTDGDPLEDLRIQEHPSPVFARGALLPGLRVRRSAQIDRWPDSLMESPA